MYNAATQISAFGKPAVGRSPLWGAMPEYRRAVPCATANFNMGKYPKRDYSGPSTLPTSAAPEPPPLPPGAYADRVFSDAGNFLFWWFIGIPIGKFTLIAALLLWDAIFK